MPAATARDGLPQGVGGGGGGLKTAAARRGWKSDGGAGIYEIVDRLEAESGEEDFKLFFLVAENLREKFDIDSRPSSPSSMT